MRTMKEDKQPNIDHSQKWLFKIGKNKIQAFQDSFAKAFDISLCILNLEGKPLTVWSNSSLFCYDIYQQNNHRCQMERQNAISHVLLNQKQYIYSCYMGRCNFVVPIMFNKQVIAIGMGSLLNDYCYGTERANDKLDMLIDLLLNSFALLNQVPVSEEVVKEEPAHSSSELFLLENKITKREIEVINKLYRGLSNKEIADKLNISEATVKTHITNILNKLRLKDRIELIIFLKQNELDL